MSTIEVSTTSEIGRTALPRRILELMQERGDAFTIRGFSQRLGISREYLRIMLAGDRPISPAMTERIAQGLGITVERLKQTDTQHLVQELTTVLGASKRTKPMLLRARDMAEKLVKTALGATERALHLNNLGRVQFFQQEYDEAHGTWLQGLEYAKLLYEQYEEKDLLHLITANLMLTYTIRKEFSHVEEILRLVEQAMPENSIALGLASSTRMNMCLELKKYRQAKEHAISSLEHYRRTNDDSRIAKAMINIAHCDYLLGDYENSAISLSSAIEHAKNYDYTLVFAVKEYVKVLIKQKNYEKAAQSIEKYESIAKDYPDIHGRLLILYTRIKNDPSFSIRISDDSTRSLQVRYFACKCLFDFYSKKGDAETALMYYERARIYSNAKSEFFEEEGF
ncbi:helix-turn-helix domain-containing protein [Tumebacillus flagellatus]|uniref:HTH cro/C1-type domain-containing protein n=1 Tax=Tumebacillus flagellatus TaxID=1157490 RepID=A0A074LUW1_9BACL|nr:helix-turn-helix transcriptional regulator [Tumebacillus flagellatus]KEO84719.1 hypothetical protein EL26_04160 [Tumebacillus flagellatus]